MSGQYLSYKDALTLGFSVEAQERYVLAVSPSGLDIFRSIAARERELGNVCQSSNSYPD